jgi:hypothetical protein
MNGCLQNKQYTKQTPFERTMFVQVFGIVMSVQHTAKQTLDRTLSVCAGGDTANLVPCKMLESRAVSLSGGRYPMFVFYGFWAGLADSEDITGELESVLYSLLRLN